MLTALDDRVVGRIAKMNDLSKSVPVNRDDRERGGDVKIFSARRKIWSLLLAVYLCTFVHSCSSGVDPTFRQIVSSPQESHFTVDELQATDRFEIRVAGEPDLTGVFTVSSRGTISYPWVGAIDVAGQTCPQVAEVISAALQQGYIRQPSVSCQITEINSRRVDILGEVSHPGSFVYEHNMTVLHVIALAQGFTDDAAVNDTAVLRMMDGQETRIRIPVDDIIAGTQPNFLLIPGDIVVVPRYQLIP